MSNRVNALLNPSNISYGFIGITTAILGYYTFFENNIEDVPEPVQDVSKEEVSKEEPIQEVSKEEPIQELPTQIASTPTQELPTQDASTPTQELPTQDASTPKPITGGKKKKSRRRK
jgi:hypothetical protein